MRFAAVLFDFDQTLVDLPAGDLAAISEFLASEPAAAGVGAEQFLAESLEVLAQQLRAGKPLGPDVLWVRHQLTCQRLGIPVREAGFQTFLAAFRATVPVYPGVPEVLAQLAGHTRLGLVTNSLDVPTQRARIAASGLSGFFGAVAIGAAVGAHKPDPEIFHWALGQLGVDAGAAVHVGDSESDDVAGALGAGLVAVRRVFHPGVATAAAAQFRDFRVLPALLADL